MVVVGDDRNKKCRRARVGALRMWDIVWLLRKGNNVIIYVRRISSA
jgi:hypothetical protein